jgi:N-glycosylase/DNA lyase
MVQLNESTEQKLVELFSRYQASKSAIQARLSEFKRVAKEEYFYELCFCICTPQSKARHAFIVVEMLKERDFFTHPFDPLEIVGNRENYIRFHNQKSLNLLKLQENWQEIEQEITANVSVETKRDRLTDKVRGIGMKEAAHFLRNIGIFGVAILDRHILKHLTALNVIEEYPTGMNRKQYLEIEAQWKEFCQKTAIPMEEMDLLFWSMETGEILK